MIEYIDTPTNQDVLVGRDTDSWNHKGNLAFRSLVAKYQTEYHSAKLRINKVAIVAKIVEDLKESGSRILKRNFRTNKWYEVDRKAYIEKVGHAIRDRQVIQQRKLRRTSKKVNVKSALKQRIKKARPSSVSRNHVEFERHGMCSISDNEKSSHILETTQNVDPIIAIQRGREAAFRNLLKEELLLTSIKKKQAVACELIKLHQQKALLAALRAREQPSILALQQHYLPSTNLKPLFMHEIDTRTLSLGF